MKRNEDTCTMSTIEIEYKKDIVQIVRYVESSNEKKLRLVLSKN
jgi:hypothetical protein